MLCCRFVVAQLLVAVDISAEGSWLFILQKLFMVEQKVPFTVQHVLVAGLGDDGIVTLEPLVHVLPDECGVVTALQSTLVVDHRK